MHPKKFWYIFIILLSFKDVSLYISTNLTVYLQRITIQFKPKTLKQNYVLKKIYT